MARSNQTKPTATPATTSARRTRSSPLNSEDPPDRDSRRTRTSAAASNTRNNQITQQNDGDDTQDEESDDDESDGEDSWKAEILAGVRAYHFALQQRHDLVRLSRLNRLVVVPRVVVSSIPAMLHCTRWQSAVPMKRPRQTWEMT